MAGTTKLMTPGGGGVALTPASSIASDVTVNVPSQNCTLGIQGPAFSASQSTTTTTNNVTWTKVTLDNEAFDTNNNFSSSRFTPTVAGYYQLNGQVQFGFTSAPCAVDFYKNGTSTGWTIGGYQSGMISAVTAISKLLYFNGSTDYVELYVYQASGSNQNTTTGLTTQMSGCLVRAA